MKLSCVSRFLPFLFGVAIRCRSWVTRDRKVVVASRLLLPIGNEHQSRTVPASAV
jgi:hypothetical protein